MYENCCKKCGSISLHTEVKGNNTGLYCDDCGAWQQWMNKNDIRVFEYNKSNKKINYQMRDATPAERESVTEYIESISEPTGINFYDNKDMITRLKEFLKFLNEKTASEYKRLPISRMDSIAQNYYCLGLQQSIRALKNILNGKDWNYKG